MTREKIVIRRGWKDPEIKVGFSHEGVFIEMSKEDFRQEFDERMKKELPKLGFNLSSEKIRQIVSETFNKVWKDYTLELQEYTK